MHKISANSLLCTVFLTSVLLTTLLTGCSGDKPAADNTAASNTSTNATDKKANSTTSKATDTKPAQSATATPATTQPSSAQHSATGEASTNNASMLPGSGKVLSALHAGGYTYAQVENDDGRQFWVATEIVDVKLNDRIKWNSAALMKDFKSTSLHRTFDQILFITSAEVEP